MAYTSPNFNEVLKDGDFFIRRYDGFFTIATPYASWDGGESFGKLFQFISGYNDRQQTISMTVPVINDVKENSKTMEFFLPSNHPIPNPIHPQLHIKTYPSSTYAVVRFRGYVNEKTVLTHYTRLRSWVENHHFEIIGTFKVARYQGPYVPFFLRMNEVWLPIKNDTFGNGHTSQTDDLES
jgi:effector-binding domain-containing protein